MAAPTFVADYSPAVGWQNSGTTKTASVTAAAGDVLVLVMLSASSDGNGAGSGTHLGAPSGGTGITWTLMQQHQVLSTCELEIYTTTVSSGQTFTCSVTNSSSAIEWNYDVLRFSGASGIGNSNKAQGSNATASVSLTTSGANSAVVAVNGDWNAVDGTTRTWATVNGITPTSGNSLERVYSRGSTTYGAYVAYWNDVGSAGTNTYSIAVPLGQQYSIATVEVLGTATNSGASVAWIGA